MLYGIVASNRRRKHASGDTSGQTSGPSIADFYVKDGGTGDGLTTASPANFATAWAAASDGKTIKLVGNTTVPKAHNWNKSVTIFADPGASDPDPYGDGSGTHPARFTRKYKLILQPPNAPGSGSNLKINTVTGGKFPKFRNLLVVFPYWPANPDDSWESIGVAGATTTSFWFSSSDNTANIECDGCEFFHGYGPTQAPYDPTAKLFDYNSPATWYFGGNGTISTAPVAGESSTAFPGHGDATWPKYNNVCLGPNIFGGGWTTFTLTNCYIHDICEFGGGGLGTNTTNWLMRHCWVERVYGDFLQTGYSANGNFTGTFKEHGNIFLDPFGAGTDALNVHNDYSQLFSNTSGVTPNNPILLSGLEAANNFFGCTRPNVRSNAQAYFWQGSANHNDPTGSNFCVIVAPKFRNCVVIGNGYKAFASDVITDPYMRNCLFVNPTWTQTNAQTLDVSFQREDLPVSMPDSKGYVANSIWEGFSASMSLRNINNADAGLRGAKIAHSAMFADPSEPAGILKPGQLFAKYRPISIYSGMGPQYATLRDMIEAVGDFTGEDPHVGPVDMRDTAAGAVITSNLFYVHGGDVGDVLPVTLPAGVELQTYAVDRATVLAPWTNTPGTLTVGQFAQLRWTTPNVALTRVVHNITLGGQSFPWSVKTGSVATFSFADNQDTAYSTIACPPAETGIRKVILAFRVMHDAQMPANGWVLGPNSAATLTKVSIASSGSPYKFATGNSGGAAGFTTNTVPSIGKWETHIIAIDWTKTVADQVVKWVINGAVQTNNGSTVDVTGTRKSSVSSLIPSTGMGVFGRADTGSNLIKGKMAFVFMHWGDETLELPDITDEAVQDKFSADLIGPNGQGPLGVIPKLFFTGNAAAWNAGMANLGSAVAQMTKTAGTYS